MPRNQSAPQRGLTTADVSVIRETAAMMIYAGLWQSIDRSTDLICDQFEVRLVDAKHSTLVIGLLRGRRYFCMETRTSAVYIGDTLADVLERAGLALPLQIGVSGECGSSFAVNPGPGVTRSQ